jgi:hypothetical protein
MVAHRHVAVAYNVRSPFMQSISLSKRSDHIGFWNFSTNSFTGPVGRSVERRAADTRRLLPQAEAVVVGDLSSIAETRWIAEQVNALGRFDAVIHNAGVGYRESRRIVRFRPLASECDNDPR